MGSSGAWLGGSREHFNSFSGTLGSLSPPWEGSTQCMAHSCRTGQEISDETFLCPEVPNHQNPSCLQGRTGLTETFIRKMFVACVYMHRYVCVIPHQLAAKRWLFPLREKLHCFQFGFVKEWGFGGLCSPPPSREGFTAKEMQML